MRWQDAGPCKGQAKVFFGGSKRSHIAQRICGPCPVSEVCFWECMVNESIDGYRYGVWGGTTTVTRDLIADVLGNPGTHEYERRRDAALAKLEPLRRDG